MSFRFGCLAGRRSFLRHRHRRSVTLLERELVGRPRPRCAHRRRRTPSRRATARVLRRVVEPPRAIFGKVVPIEARGPQMGVSEPLPYLIGPSIGVSSPVETEGLYFRQILRGNVVFGGRLKGPALPEPDPRVRGAGQHAVPMLKLRRFVPAHLQQIARLSRCPLCAVASSFSESAHR